MLSDRIPVNGTYLLRRPMRGRWKDAEWSTGPELKTARADHSCSLLAGVKVAIVGGQVGTGGITDQVEFYDVSSNELGRGENSLAKLCKQTLP